MSRFGFSGSFSVSNGTFRRRRRRWARTIYNIQLLHIAQLCKTRFRNGAFRVTQKWRLKLKREIDKNVVRNELLK